MQAYRTYLTIIDPKQVILTDLPFRPGQRIEVLLLAPEEERSEATDKLRDLFDRTQAISDSQGIDEDVIRQEIDAYRSGQ